MRDLLFDIAQRGCDLLMDCRPYGDGASGKAPKVVAHRGAWDRADNIENTLTAFHHAKMLGADAVELDIHFTRDNVPVVHHDSELIRLFQKDASIGSLTFAELRALVPQVPSLAEVLDISHLHFMIEIKKPLGVLHEKILMTILDRFEPVRDFHLLALNPDLVRISDKFPGAAWLLVGELSLTRLAEISLREQWGGVAGHYLAMTDKLIARLHSAGQSAGSGFIPTKNLYCREWNRGVDFVFTNSTSRLF